ncbi:hypothetical protein [Nostoc punctiforme]|uniref:hypothetical protein n=1 Tax=Nostoc punctiforme TaxID=272131 RepID=UPI000045BEF1|nr:hypothetical protein [Nostoc punctiforme]
MLDQAIKSDLLVELSPEEQELLAAGGGDYGGYGGYKHHYGGYKRHYGYGHYHRPWGHYKHHGYHHW